MLIPSLTMLIILGCFIHFIDGRWEGVHFLVSFFKFPFICDVHALIVIFFGVLGKNGVEL